MLFGHYAEFTKAMGPLLKCEAVFYILIGDRKKKKPNPERVHNELRFPIEVVWALLDIQYPESFSVSFKREILSVIFWFRNWKYYQYA